MSSRPKKPTPAEIRRMAVWKLTGQTSCYGCRYLYRRHEYVEKVSELNGDVVYKLNVTRIHCALGLNPNLPVQPAEISRYRPDIEAIKFAIGNHRCINYGEVTRIASAIGSEVTVDDHPAKAKRAIERHTRRLALTDPDMDTP